MCGHVYARTVACGGSHRAPPATLPPTRNHDGAALSLIARKNVDTRGERRRHIEFVRLNRSHLLPLFGAWPDSVGITSRFTCTQSIVARFQYIQCTIARSRE